MGAGRRVVGLSSAAFARQPEARNPVTEFNVGASAISFRTASTIRSNSTSLIARSIAPGRHSAARTIRGTALIPDRHASLLFEGSLAVASVAKKGRNRERSNHALAKPVAPMTCGGHPWPNLSNAC